MTNRITIHVYRAKQVLGSKYENKTGSRDFLCAE